MIKSETILYKLKNKGHRLTKVRRALVDVFTQSEAPLSALDLQGYLEENNIKVNKTTIYRELNFLSGQKVIHEIHFGDGKSRYRACPDIHHHHVICVRCSRVEELVTEEDFTKEERVISCDLNFKVLYHTLEFFGLCGDCGEG